MAHQDETQGFRTEKPALLCLDPNEHTLRDLHDILEINGFHAYQARSLGEALEVLVRHSPPVILTEILFEGIEPLDVLRALRKNHPHSVILIHTAQEERRSGPDRRLGQIFEYLVKPSSPHELVAHIRRAFAFYKEKLTTLNFSEENESRMRNQLEWLIWKEQTSLSDKIHFGKSMIENIKNSISQGMGVGGLVTLIEIVQLAARQEGDKYLIPVTSMKSLFNTAEFVRGWLANLETITNAFSRSYKLEAIPGHEVEEIICSCVKDAEPFRAIKGQRVVTSDMEFSLPLNSNVEALRLILMELLVNAFKYSPDASTVHITRFRTGNSVSIVVMNEILPMAGGITGVPEELENDVFEPFVKLNQFYDERFYQEEFGMGIGLTIIHNAMFRMGGKIHIFEVVDHATERSPTKKVVAELIFPIEDTMK